MRPAGSKWNQQVFSAKTGGGGSFMWHRNTEVKLLHPASG